ncbi:hypothetical protein LMH87_004899 [Akanthomyces muscarius]|uniref:DUF1993 domain-containing protein n=1 Tax=Akanthomyces muscarius TaxID=2231603 RepID=A0A9W8UIK3_AKAMU|nr:hypothetical protein LMH87_004899 [Akanthomyces muscarius]KAJ4146069.1 hypothetical protein LMH87_004899 [Akanthomyces muscarius]
MAHSQFNGYNAFFVPAFDIVATTLSLLTVAESSPNATTLLTARTHETMIPFSGQCGIIATCIDKLVSRVCDISPQGWGYHDALPSYATVRGRLHAAQALLKNADQDTVNTSIATGTLTLPLDDGEAEVPLHTYVTSFNMSYLFFHLVTAYNILRKEGVELGKNGYMLVFNETLGGKPLLWEN